MRMENQVQAIIECHLELLLTMVITAKQLRADEYPLHIILSVCVEIALLIYVCPVNASGGHLDDRREDLWQNDTLSVSQGTKRDVNTEPLRDFDDIIILVGAHADAGFCLRFGVVVPRSTFLEM